MFIQTLKYASPKNSKNSNETQQRSRISRPSSAQINSIAAFDDFIHNSPSGSREPDSDNNELPYSQSDLCLGLSGSPLESMKDSPTFRFRRQHSAEGYSYQSNNGSYFVNFDGSPTQHPEVNSIQYVRPSMYMFSTDSQGNFVTPRTPIPGAERVRWKSSQAQSSSRPSSRGSTVAPQNMAFLPNLPTNDSPTNVGAIPGGSLFKYATKKFSTSRLVKPVPQTRRTRQKTTSENSHLSMNANIVRAQIARRRRQQRIQYTAKATQNLLRTQSNTNVNTSASNSSRENYDANESGNVKETGTATGTGSNSSRMHSSRSMSPLDDQSQYYVNLAKKRQLARQRAAAAAKLIKRKNSESRVPKTYRNRYRDEKIRRLTDLNTEMTDQKLDIWSNILSKESWTNQMDMFDSHWFSPDSDLIFQRSNRGTSQDIQQIETLINGKDARDFFDDLEMFNDMSILS